MIHPTSRPEAQWATPARAEAPKEGSSTFVASEPVDRQLHQKGPLWRPVLALQGVCFASISPRLKLKCLIAGFLSIVVPTI